MQTLLGAGGAIGAPLAKELTQYTDHIRLVSRNPKKVNPNDELMPADLSDSQQVEKAIEGSEIVYLIIGFEYNIKVWRTKWPALMRAVIDGCKKFNAKLVFFDNVYMYDRDYLSHMTEETPIRPTSKKGEVRAQLINMLMEAINKKDIEALIARAADFYGPGVQTSVLQEVVYKNYLKDKSANWFADTGKVHNLTYTPDAAKATAMLGNTPEAYNQVWHLPTDHTKITGKQWAELFAKEMQVKPKISAMPIWMLGLIGIFVPIMKELQEMAYQYDRDYYFDSSKFEKRFNFVPTKPADGVKEVVDADR